MGQIFQIVVLYGIVFIEETDNLQVVRANIRDTQVVNDIINSGTNVGFSFVILDKSMQRLPRQCETIISIDKQRGAIKHRRSVHVDHGTFHVDPNRMFLHLYELL